MNKPYLVWQDVGLKHRMMRVALQVLDSHALAEEVVQQAYLRLLERDVGAVANPSSWLLKVTRNLAIDRGRRLSRERELLRLVPCSDLCAPCTDPDDDRHAIESRLAQIVSSLLQASGTRVTAIILLHIVLGLSYEDIAKISGHSAASCRQSVRRVRRKCADNIDAEELATDKNNVDMYVQAILDASMEPLMESLSVQLPVSMQQGVVMSSLLCRYCNDVPSRSGRTRQVLALTSTGVQWVLVLDGMVLCEVDNNLDFSNSIADLI